VHREPSPHSASPSRLPDLGPRGEGWVVIHASPAALVVALGLGIFFDTKARREEAWLLAAYPGYATYRRRVRKLVPFVY